MVWTTKSIAAVYGVEEWKQSGSLGVVDSMHNLIRLIR